MLNFNDVNFIKHDSNVFISTSHLICQYFFKYFYIILLSTVSIIIICYLLYKGSRKMSHRFWYNQPVNFSINHNKGTRIIANDIPKTNKWVNYKNISFYSLYDEENYIENIQTFLTTNYKQESISDYIYTPLHLTAYLKGHNNPVFIGIYKDNTAMVKNNEMIGCITAYPLNILSKKTPIKTVYYVDNLCVKTDMRSKNIAPQMIATIYDHFRKNTDSTKIAIFKRENFCDNYIVPVICYHTSLYHIDNWFHRKYQLHASAKVLDVSKQNINLLYSFIYTNTNLELIILPELSNVECLIDDEQLFIKLLIVDEQISAMYVFRDSNTMYNGARTIECIGSINNQKNTNFFVNGFFFVLEELYTKHKFKILQMENQSHNYIITKKIQKKWTPYHVVPIAWFFYNYIFPQQSPNTTLILA